MDCTALGVGAWLVTVLEKQEELEWSATPELDGMSRISGSKRPSMVTSSQDIGSAKATKAYKVRVMRAFKAIDRFGGNLVPSAVFPRLPKEFNQVGEGGEQGKECAGLATRPSYGRKAPL